MNPEALKDIVVSEVREECNELALVLAAQSIPVDVRWDGSIWRLSVPAVEETRARLEIEAYRTESRLSRASPPAAEAHGTAWPGVVAYALLITTIALLAPDMRFGVDWLAVGRMDGGGIRVGEWWRPITALFLHADAAHLIGNLVFGGFFAYSVARYFGGGLAWLAIVASAALANLVNGMLQGADHRSIGASTAVFAALGLLSAYLWRRGFPSAASRRERMAPVVAGLGLLAFTGTGGVNTDLGAHLLGFFSGFGCGLAFAITGVTKSPRLQAAAAVLTLAVLAAAWTAAVGSGA